MPDAPGQGGDGCNQCLFWAARQDQEPTTGQCRRLPPMAQVGLALRTNYLTFGPEDEDREMMPVWPVTRAGDWCGSFRSAWG